MQLCLVSSRFPHSSLHINAVRRPLNKSLVSLFLPHNALEAVLVPLDGLGLVDAV